MILVIFVVSSQGILAHILPTNLSEKPKEIVLAPTPKKTQEQIGAYRISTECELIYGFASGNYPDGQKLPALKIADLLEKYPQEFGPWKATLENNQTRTDFFKQKPLPADFSEVLVTAVMKETSISPDLKSIASLITDPEGRTKLQDAFKKFDCQPYFDERAKQ